MDATPQHVSTLLQTSHPAASHKYLPGGADPLRFCHLDRPCHDPQQHARIAENAYYRAQRRHFAPGHELDDWLAAEQEESAHDAGVHEGDNDNGLFAFNAF